MNDDLLMALQREADSKDDDLADLNQSIDIAERQLLDLKRRRDRVSGYLNSLLDVLARLRGEP